MSSPFTRLKLLANTLHLADMVNVLGGCFLAKSVVDLVGMFEVGGSGGQGGCDVRNASLVVGGELGFALCRCCLLCFQCFMEVGDLLLKSTLASGAFVTEDEMLFLKGTDATVV